MHHSSRGRPARADSKLLSAVLLAVTVGACGPTEDRGYDKVSHQVNPDIPAPAMPEPPPVIEGIGEQQQVVAANLPQGVTQEMVDAGQELYGGVCAGCHGPAGRGTTLAPGLADTEWINISGAYDEIVNVIHTGVPNPQQYPGAMPPLGGGSFNDEQVRALSAYVLALSQQGGA